MKIGIISDNLYFCEKIIEELKKYNEIKEFKNIISKSKIQMYGLKKIGWKQEIKWLMKWSDLLFFDWVTIYLAIASMLPKKSKIIARLHSYEIYSKITAKVNWKNVDKIILINEAMEDKFVSLFPDCIGKTMVIPNYIDEDKFILNNSLNSNNLGTLCRIDPIKRVYDLILSFYEIYKEDRRLKLKIGGAPTPREPRYFDSIQSLIKKLGLEKSVILDGWVPNPEIWLRNIDIYISNSFWETMNTSMIEATLCGCFPLSHFWDSCHEFLPSDNVYSTQNELKEKVFKFYKLSSAEKEENSVFMRDHMIKKYSKMKVSNIFNSLFNEEMDV